MSKISQLLRRHPMNAGQAARYLDMTQGHLYNLLARRRGPRHLKYRRQLRFRQADLDRWLARLCRAVTCADPWKR